MSNDLNGTEIAIIGMAGRFPRASNVREYWRNLCGGVEAITFFSDEQLSALGVDPGPLGSPAYVKAAALLDGFDMFDAAFFGINPREAELMDPQHRLLLECAWEALENAGYNPESCKRSIGVYAGATINTYLLLNVSSNPEALNSVDELQVNLTNGADFLTTRISYKLNLKGPSHVVQSACSTSLVAVHVSCQSLLNGECDMALAGGVSINVKHRNGYQYVAGGMTSPDGHCRAFDANAQGTIFGSGVGLVVLKRLDDALADRDRIHAVIRGSAINNDGSLKVGYTAPSVDGQAGAITEALANAGVNPETITYVETHGTGTPLGDPVEIQALTKAFGAATSRKQFCAIGSVKTNIGHLDAAAGVAGLIKTAMALEHRLIPPSLHFERPNPDIDFANSPFYVNAKLSEWKTSGAPARAGVSAFGVGGTNAHVVLEEAPGIQASSEPRPWQLILLSAKTNSALNRMAANLADFLEINRSLNLADVAYTLQTGRKAMSHRLAVVCKDTAQAVDTLRSAGPEVLRRVTEGPANPVVFLFPGQGSQYAGMGSGLYCSEPYFKEQVDHCAEIMRPHLGLDIRTVLYPETGAADEAADQLKQTFITQPALFVIEYSLARLLISWGIRPQAMIGHSIGEYVAACLAEVFTLEDAISLVCARGRMMQQMPEGAMLAVPLSESRILPMLDGSLSLAAVNAGSQCVVSGPLDEIEQFQARLSESGVTCRPLQTSHAFHSRMMEPVVAPFSEQLRKIKTGSPIVPFISNVTGTWMTAEAAREPDYWATQLRHTVRFHEGVTVLLEKKERVILEVGPGRSLGRLVKRHQLIAPEQPVIASIRGKDETQSDEAYLMQAIGHLWLAGADIDWEGMYKAERRNRVELPTYPFERERFWIDARKERASEREQKKTDEKRFQIADWFYVPTWERSLQPARRETKERDGIWVVFEDGDGIGAELVKRKRAEGAHVTAVKRGGSYEERGEDYVLTDAPEDCEAMLRSLARKGRPLSHIVHLWGLGQIITSSSEETAVDRIRRVGFAGILTLAGAIKQESPPEVRLTVAAAETMGVTGCESTQFEKMINLAACKVIPQEFPHIACRFIDGVPGRESWQRAMLADQILSEIENDSGDLVVAYRGNQRWVQRYKPAGFSNDVMNGPVLRSRGAYLIGGGLSGVGYALAKYLAKEFKARLVITDSAKLPAREKWKNLLESCDLDCDDEPARKIKKALALEELGADVRVAGVGGPDAAQLEAAVKECLAEFGVLNGVIYSVDSDEKAFFKPIRELNASECEPLFESRIAALSVLEELLQDVDLDFCIVNSSLSAVIGGLGSLVYTSESLLGDAFVQDHNRRSPASWTSVNWDAWQLEDEAEQLTSVSDELARLAITPEEGEEAFRQILMLTGTDQVVVSTTDLTSRIEKHLKGGLQRVRTQAASAGGGSELHRRPSLTSAFVAPGSEFEREITAIWEETLGIEGIGVQDNFFELGGDSLVAIQVAAQLKDELSIEVPVVSLYECLTVRSLVEFLRSDERGSVAAAGSDQRGDRTLRRKDYQEKKRAKRKQTRN